MKKRKILTPPCPPDHFTREQAREAVRKVMEKRKRKKHDPPG